MKIDVYSIRTDGGTQPRSELIESVLEEYIEDWKNGSTFPAINVVYDGDNYWLYDGFHRVKSAKRAGIEKIEADIEQGTQRDAVLKSVGVNATHGLRRTNADKRRAVMTLLNDNEWSQWSDREISRRCAVDNSFVSRLRKENLTVDQQQSEPTERTYTTKHGTTAKMNTGNIGKRNIDSGHEDHEPEDEEDIEPDLDFEEYEDEPDDYESFNSSFNDTLQPDYVIRWLKRETETYFQKLGSISEKHQVANEMIKYFRQLSGEYNRQSITVENY